MGYWEEGERISMPGWHDDDKARSQESKKELEHFWNKDIGVQNSPQRRIQTADT